jgi:flagellar motility protein MotE (MotC chaperone)
MERKKSIRYFVPFVISFFILVGGLEKVKAEEPRNFSDVRLELISEMERLKDEKKLLKEKLEKEENEKIKKALEIKLKAIEERIIELKKQLENYNNGISSVG